MFKCEIYILVATYCLLADVQAYIKESTVTGKFKIDPSKNTVLSRLPRSSNFNTAELIAWMRVGNSIELNEMSDRFRTDFDNRLASIIEEAYGKNLENVEIILKTIENLQHSNQKAIGYSTLYKTMKNNRHLDSYQLIMLAFKIKEFMEIRTYEELAENYKTNFTTLQNNLSSSVRGLVWSTRVKCNIKNMNYNEYLYCANSFRDYWAYTWIPGNIDYDAHWELIPIENGKYFHLFNTYHNRYLVQGNLHDSQRREVHTESENGKKWQFVPENDTFFIKDTHYNEFLYADIDKRCSDRRYVYTWSSSSVTDTVKQRSKWDIKCNN